MLLPNTIVFFGVSRAGKSSLGARLQATYGFELTAFADPIKLALRMMFGFDDEHLWGSSAQRETPYPEFESAGWCFECGAQCRGPERHYINDLRILSVEEVDELALTHASDNDYWHCDICGATSPKAVTPREAAKTLGTGWGRRFCKNMWAQIAFRRMDPARPYVVADGRFENELEHTRRSGAVSVLLLRGLQESTSPHPSEAEVRFLAKRPELFDIVLDNRYGEVEDNYLRLLEALELYSASADRARVRLFNASAPTDHEDLHG